MARESPETKNMKVLGVAVAVGTVGGVVLSEVSWVQGMFAGVVVGLIYTVIVTGYEEFMEMWK